MSQAALLSATKGNIGSETRAQLAKRGLTCSHCACAARASWPGRREIAANGARPSFLHIPVSCTQVQSSGQVIALRKKEGRGCYYSLLNMFLLSHCNITVEMGLCSFNHNVASRVQLCAGAVELILPLRHKYPTPLGFTVEHLWKTTASVWQWRLVSSSGLVCYHEASPRGLQTAPSDLDYIYGFFLRTCSHLPSAVLSPCPKPI